jgi:hypothetical protein
LQRRVRLPGSSEKTEKRESQQKSVDKSDEKNDEYLPDDATHLGSNPNKSCRIVPECWGSFGTLFRLSILMLIRNLIHLLSGWADSIVADLPERFRNNWTESQVIVGTVPTNEKKKRVPLTCRKSWKVPRVPKPVAKGIVYPTYPESPKEVPKEPKIQAKGTPYREPRSVTDLESCCTPSRREVPRESEIVATGKHRYVKQEKEIVIGKDSIVKLEDYNLQCELCSEHPIATPKTPS